MKPLRVALFVKASAAPLRRDDRNMGYWSYPVPEFTWDHYPHDGGRVDLAEFRDYDLIFHEDAGFCAYDNRRQGPPVVFLSIDSTLSDDHYQKRLVQGKQSDLILVDHDRLERFRPSGRPVRRFTYCVNDNVFRPLSLSLDVCYHCGSGESKGAPGGKERNQLRAALGEHCQKIGLSFASGAVGLDEYAYDMGRARIVVNLPRTVTNRPHRVFDALACAAALLTGPIPVVDGDGLEAGKHYREFTTTKEALDSVSKFSIDGWISASVAGNELILSRHTWSVRSQELRQMLYKELGL